MNKLKRIKIISWTTRTFLVTFLLFSSCSLSDKKKDTLSPGVDNVQILLDLSTKVYEKQHEKALQYALTALELSRKKNDNEAEASSLKTIADIFYKFNFYRKALPYYNSSLTLFQNQSNSSLINISNQSIGDIYYKLNFSDSALIFYNRALKGYQEKGTKIGIGTSLLRIGNVYWTTNNYDKALEYYINSLLIYEDINYTAGLARVYINIGSTYFVTEYYDKAIEYFLKSKQILDEHHDSDVLAELYLRMGETYAKKNLHKEAIQYYDASLALYDSTSNNLNKAWVYKAKSNTLHELKRYDDALELANTALKIGEIYDDKWFNASINNTLANYFLEKHVYAEALIHLKKAASIASSLKSWSILKENYLSFSRYYSLKGDYKSSLVYYKNFQRMSDSIQNKERNDRIAKLQTRFESEHNKRELQLKEQELKNNKAKLQKQRYQLYFFGFGVVVVLFLSFALYRQYKILELKGRKIERINEELDQRVKERTSALRLTQFSIEQASDPIFWLSPSGKYIFANKSACENLEYSKDQIVTLSITDIIPNFNSDDWQQFWNIIKKDKSLILESFHKKKSGKAFPVEIILNYIAHEGNEFAFAYVRDNTERKLREENLKKAKDKAEEADKLKSAFLANMSHEIRTPMNAIIGFSDLLISNEYSEEEKFEFGNLIKNSGSSLLKLIDDIIDISIMEAGHLKLNISSVHVNNHLNEILMFFQEEKERLGKSIVDIKLNIPPNSNKIIIDTDPIRFRQVITNLVGNALKFTESGSIEIGYNIGNDPVLHFYVKDSGIGIKAEKIDMIFERFNKLEDDRRIYAGTGLGLTISKKIVEELGGFMYVESEYAKGSTFSFTLPYYRSEYFQKEEPVETDIPRNKKYLWEDKKILIVEDVDSNYLFLETLIGKTKAKVTWAKTGIQAINLCEKIKPDIILMDIQLPELNGYEATKQIRLSNKDVPIIAQTAYAFSGEKEKIKNAGCNDYITKPINPGILMETINKYLT